MGLKETFKYNFLLDYFKTKEGNIIIFFLLFASIMASLTIYVFLDIGVDTTELDMIETTLRFYQIPIIVHAETGYAPDKLRSVCLHVIDNYDYHLGKTPEETYKTVFAEDCNLNAASLLLNTNQSADMKFYSEMARLESWRVLSDAKYQHIKENFQGNLLKGVLDKVNVGIYFTLFEAIGDWYGLCYSNSSASEYARALDYDMECIEALNPALEKVTTEIMFSINIPGDFTQSCERITKETYNDPNILLGCNERRRFLQYIVGNKESIINSHEMSLSRFYTAATLYQAVNLRSNQEMTVSRVLDMVLDAMPEGEPKKLVESNSEIYRRSWT